MGSSSIPNPDGFVVGRPEADYDNQEATPSDEVNESIEFVTWEGSSLGRPSVLTDGDGSYSGDGPRTKSRKPLEDDGAAAKRKEPPFRNERIVAPICVLLLHAALVSDVIIHREVLQIATSWSFVIWTSTFLSSVSYLSAALTDPGFLKRSGTRAPNPVAIGRQIYDRIRGDDKSTLFKKNEEMDIEMAPLDEEKVLQDRLCKRCMIKQPLRTKHCRDCDWCIRTHDHHCPWLGNCVGENNRAYYLSLIRSPKIGKQE